MPLITDATALRALGHVGGIDWLQHVDGQVVVPEWVYSAEARRYRDQIDAAVRAGWLSVEAPSATLVFEMQRITGLDKGEAEVLVLSGPHGTTTTRVRLLIDEHRAFEYVDNLLRKTSGLRLELMCLAQVLHTAEANGCVSSASDVMQNIMDDGVYSWASAVRSFYERWCKRLGVNPVP